MRDRRTGKDAWLDEVPARVLIEIAADPEKYKAQFDGMASRKKAAEDAEAASAVVHDKALKASRIVNTAQEQLDGDRKAHVVQVEADRSGIARAKVAADARVSEASALEGEADRVQREINETYTNLNLRETCLNDLAAELDEREQMLNAVAVKQRDQLKAIQAREKRLTEKLNAFRDV